MDHRLLVTVRILICIFVGQAFGCTITDFVQMNMMERLAQSTYVVYGKTIWHTPTKVGSQWVIDATYEVHCIFKEGEDPMSEQIIISQISPAPDCFGTNVASNLKVGDYSIIALKNTTDPGKYMLEEVMPELSATFDAAKPYFFSLANLCGLQSWKAPIGATTNKCPVCGISDFASDVSTQGGILTNCEFTTSAIVANVTTCDLYISGTIDYANAQTCIPASYNQSCVTLLYRSASATCDCNVQTTNRKVGTAGGLVPIPSKAVTLLLIMLMFLLCGNNHD